MSDPPAGHTPATPAGHTPAGHTPASSTPASSTLGAPAQARPHPTRWIDAFSGMFLIAACLLVLVAASPSLLRAATGADLFERAPADDLEQPHPRLRLQGIDQDESDSNELAPEDDPHLFLPRSPDSPGEPPARRRPHDSAKVDEAEETDVPLGSLRIGAAREHVTLLDRPEADGVTLGELSAGETVVLVKEVDDWVLVQGKNAKMGWARKAEIWTGADRRK